ncbi:MAG: hypothetical protein JJ975_10740 [Bacteroidia bacterium]|nr:hypothetical protein [Bacteroidia bacterium]
METSALITMVLVQVAVTAITGYFFYRVLTAPQRPEPDSYTDNDPPEDTTGDHLVDK